MKDYLKRKLYQTNRVYAWKCRCCIKPQEFKPARRRARRTIKQRDKQMVYEDIATNTSI